MRKKPTSDISTDEKIGRAILFHFYQPGTNELSTSAMWGKKGETSVSRLEILELDQLKNIWMNELHNPPERQLIQVAIFSQNDLQEAKKSLNDRILVLHPDPCCVQKEYKVYSSNDCTKKCPYNFEQVHCPVESGLCDHPCTRNYAHALIISIITKGEGNKLNAFLISNNMIHDITEK